MHRTKKQIKQWIDNSWKDSGEKNGIIIPFEIEIKKGSKNVY